VENVGKILRIALHLPKLHGPLRQRGVKISKHIRNAFHSVGVQLSVYELVVRTPWVGGGGQDDIIVLIRDLHSLRKVADDLHRGVHPVPNEWSPIPLGNSSVWLIIEVPSHSLRLLSELLRPFDLEAFLFSF